MAEAFSPSSVTFSSPDFLAGGGAAGARLRAVDWSRTPLGAARDWPEALKGAVRLLLASPSPLCLWWGPELHHFHNDACARILGDDAHARLGRPAPEAWPALWVLVQPAVDGLLTRGEAGAAPACTLRTLNLHGAELQHDVSCTPWGHEGTVGGVLCSLSDVTEARVGSRRLSLFARLAEVSARASTAHALIEAAALELEAMPELPGCTFVRVDAEGRVTALTGAEAGARPPDPELQEVALRAVATGDPQSFGAVAQSMALPIGRLAAHEHIVWVVSGKAPLAQSQRDFARLVGRHLASAVSHVHARDGEALRLEAEALQEVARDLAAELDLQSLVQKVTDIGTRLTGARFGAFFYNVEGDNGEAFQLYTLSGAPREAFERLGLPRATAIFKPTFDGQGPVRIADVTRDPRYGRNAPHRGMPEGHLPVRSYLAVPVVSRRGNVIGGLFFAHPEPGVFDSRSERNATGLAAQAAIAFDNAHLYGQARDEIDRRRRMEAELRESERRYRELFDEMKEQVDGLTLLHDLAMKLGGLSEMEPALRAVLETAIQAQGADKGIVWLPEEGSGALLSQVSHGFEPEDLLAFDRVTPGPAGGGAGNAFARGTRYVIEDVEGEEGFAQYREAAGRAGFRALHSTPIVTRAGELLGVLSVHFRDRHRPTQRAMQMADVCARHAADAIEAARAIEGMRRSERIFRAMGESIDYGVWICDRAGHASYLSESFVALTGLPREQSLGLGWIESLHPDDREPVRAAWQDCVARGGDWDVELRVMGANGTCHAVLSRGVPVRDARGVVSGWAGINLDIGRLKQVENELRELDQRKNEFLATLAHELRNPLAPLRNGLEVLRLAGSNPALTLKAREMMERQLKQMVRLVDDLLEVSRISRGKIELRREDVELSAVLRNALEQSQPLMDERGHRLETRIPDDPVIVHGDAARLSQVFGNLLNNAAKYTEAGGHVELSVRVEGDEAVVAVRDNGIGIPEDMLAQVFDIFTQVDRSLEKSQGGLGIGLSIAKRLVEMHGGCISVSSGGHRKGSEFSVRLPARVAARPADDGAATGGWIAPGSLPRRRVLVADDNEDSAATLSIMLEVIGNDVRVARDGREAVDVAAGWRPDVVLLDIGMPRLNGYDACRFIRELPGGKDVFIVALTGWGGEDDRIRAVEAGFDRHLVKPVEPKMLERLVAEIPRPREACA